MNINKRKKFYIVSLLSELLKIKFIIKTPEITINNKALVCLVDPSEKGFGNSNPKR